MKEDKFCEWCKRTEQRLWRLFILASAAIGIIGALVVALTHLLGA
jgi:hypothetical protein